MSEAAGGAPTAGRADEHALAQRLLARLDERGWSIATAESLTGGLVVASLVSVPGASARVRGGIVSYATALKHSLLGVDADYLARFGPVRAEVATQMAEGVRAATAIDGAHTDVGLATTGNAGPTSEDGQPVGTVHVAVATPEGTRVASLLLAGDRRSIRAQTVEAVLRLALEWV